MTTLTYGATTITLSNDLLWTDEFDWSAVEQTASYSITGSLIVEAGQRAAGRKITLEGADGGWATRLTVLALRTAANIAGQQFTLTLRGVAHTVMIESVEARPVFEVSDPVDADFYALSLKFIEV